MSFVDYCAAQGVPPIVINATCLSLQPDLKPDALMLGSSQSTAISRDSLCNLIKGIPHPLEFVAAALRFAHCILRVQDFERN